jgi:hypothetical protein
MIINYHMQLDASTLGLMIRKVKAMPPDQKKSILETDAKIKQWLNTHPGEGVTAERVPEILATKLETPKAELEKMFEPSMDTEQPKLEPAPIPEPAKPEPLMPQLEQKPLIQPMSLQAEAANIMQKGEDFGLAESKRETEQKVASIQAIQPKAPEVTHSMSADAELAKQVEQAFESEIDDIYGKKGLFGKTRGVDTQEWKFMKSLPAAKVLSYYQADSSGSALDQSIAQELTGSGKHQMFLKQVDSLMKESRGKIKPYENEAIEQFLRRLGHFVMREHLENQVLTTPSNK